ncbi:MULTISPECIES: phospho-N-acetylmuramoyl-pentapeptide-transferase [unclassified Veillonella]|uniref:phospho-N-acetylmuramoyl-pentapeptide- transferase n=1 Tax=unclassified Veillonella TaxID=2630086 RepID=UPI000F8C31B5
MNMDYAVAFGLALISTLVFGKIGIPLLQRLKAQQSIREDGPQAHLAKAGTPTMGGLFMMLALVITVCIVPPYSVTLWMLLFLTLGHGALGFSDDFIKAVKRRNLGLTAKQKLLGQAVLAIVFCYISIAYAALPTTLWIPLVDITVDLGYAYYVLAFIIILGTTNAVNLTDGLDGLATGISAIAGAAFAVVGLLVGSLSVTFFGIIVSAVCLGFLYFNANPAKVFMGDTGSLALGGAFAGMAIATKTELLLIVIGFVFVVEALSVILQVASFKTRGVRIFRMSPIHHHFELGGWSERKVVYVFWAVSLITALLGIALLSMK